MAGVEMAGAVVGLVAEYLAVIIKEEVESLGGVRHEVAEFEKSLRSISAFLKDAETLQDRKEGVKEWVRQVRDVAYDIENVVDEFLLCLGPKQPHRRGFASCPSRFARFTRQLRARRQIGAEIKRIKRLLHGIEERKNMFSTTSLVEKVTGSDASSDTRRLTQPLFTEDSEIVGIEKPKHELMEKLFDENSSLAVISVFGMGGLGKTTLVRKVYQNERVQRRFNCFAWVTVSQSFSSTVIFRRLLIDFMGTRKESFIGCDEEHHSMGEKHQYSIEEMERMDHAHIVERLSAFMRSKRYVVVLDDVWTTSAWEDLRYVFPENGLRCRIMITTRRHDVALYCSRSQENVHKMEPLPEKVARALLCKKAFGGTCPPELETTLMNILKICKGLPLAIVTMGGLLLSKAPSTIEWNRVLANLTAILEKNETTNFMNQVLSLSYDDLPHYLKYCMLYFGSYPEDFLFNAFGVIQQWVAEGFVKSMNEWTHVDLANDYLHELVNRSLIEIVEYDCDGSVWTYRVHDLMHRLIRQKMREENFFTLATDDINPNKEVRRLSVRRGDNVPTGRNFSRLRNLRMLEATEIPALSSFRMLRLLNLSGAQIQMFPSEITKLYHLKYLNLKNTSIDMIPRSIKNLHKLQTLDLRRTDVMELPVELLHLHSIRHLRTSNKIPFEGVRMPTELGTLKCLQELLFLRLDGIKEQAIQLGKLTELRILSISNLQKQDYGVICDSIMNMRHLKKLYIATNNGEEESFHINFMSTLSPTLLCVDFFGRLKMLPELIGPFLSLVYLTLGSSGLREDPLKALQHLPMLRRLVLFQDAFMGEEMSCGEDGYRRLEKVIIEKLGQLRFVHIGKGAMPKLAVMVISECLKLDGLPFGVENLKAIREFTFRDMPREFIENVREKKSEQLAKVKHIPLVQHFFWDGKRREVEDLS